MINDYSLISAYIQQEKKENGPLHGVIDPLMATEFARQGKVPKQTIKCKKFKSSYRTVILPGEQAKVKVKLSIIPYARSCDPPEKGGTLVDPEQWSNMTLFMTKNQMREEQQNQGVDVWILLGEPRVEDAGYHVLTARWLAKEINKHCHDATFEFLTSQPSCKNMDGIQVDRRNGANGNSNTFDPSFFEEVHDSEEQMSWEIEGSCCHTKRKGFCILLEEEQRSQSWESQYWLLSIPLSNEWVPSFNGEKMVSRAKQGLISRTKHSTVTTH